MKEIIKKSLMFIISIAFSSVFAETFQGSFQIIVTDDFKKQRSEYFYSLRVGQQLYYLDLTKNLLKNPQIKTGDQVTVEGNLIDENGLSHIVVHKINLNGHKKEIKESALTGQDNVLTVMVNFTDMKATDSISQSVLQQELYTNTISVNSLYKASSSKQFTFYTSPDTTGNQGIYTASLNYAAGSACNFSSWADDALNAIAQQGVNLSNYKHSLIILPQNVNCSFSGMGYLGCSSSSFYCRAWVVAATNITALMAHELGHNLGLNDSDSNLNNSGNIVQFGDESDFMSYAFTYPLNAEHRDTLSWYQAYPYKLTTVTQSGQYIINSLDQDANILQVLKISKQNNNGYYYISYRTNTPPFGLGSPYSNSLNIHYSAPNDTHSYLVSTLAVSQTFVDSANGITVNFLSDFMSCAVIVNVILS